MSEQGISSQEQEAGNVQIELAKVEDAQDVYNVQKETWIKTYANPEMGITEDDVRARFTDGKIDRAENWRRSIESSDQNHHSVYVARMASKVVGISAPFNRDGQRRLGALYVLPEFQGQGIGSKLIENALGWHGNTEPIYLHVATYNHAARKLYEKYGFVETGRDISDEAIRFGPGKTIPEIEMVKRPT